MDEPVATQERVGARFKDALLHGIVTRDERVLEPLIAAMRWVGHERVLEPFIAAMRWVGQHQREMQGALGMLTLFEAAEQERRQAGGRRTGANEHQRAQNCWQLYTARYAELLTKGAKPAQARRQLAAEFKLPYHDDYLRKMLRGPGQMKKSRMSA